MSGASLFTGTGYWSAEGHPLLIEYFVPVMERIRAEAIEGFNRTGAGGFETGGVLFGAFEGDAVRILAHRPFSCEYAMGPAFMLSERDFARFDALLCLPEVDPELHGLQAVGWYHSHTRHGIYLSERDLETHNRLFPGGNHVALVVRPDIFGSVRAGFFFREPDGATRADSSYCEFDIAPPQRAAGLDLPRARPEPRLRQEPELPSLPPMPGLGLPEEEEEIRPARRGFPWVAVLFALVIALAAAAAALYYGILLPRPTMALVVKDLGGPVRISWDRASRPIVGARGGILDIFDGGQKKEMEIDPDALQDGSVIYTPTSSTIDVHLKVDRAGGGTHEESVRFVGPPRPAAQTAAAPVAPEPPQPQTEAPIPSSAEAAPAQVQPEPPQQAEPKSQQRPEQKPKPEAPKTLARFQAPAPAASAATGSALPPPPSLRPSGARVAQSSPAPLVENVPGPPPSLPPPERPKPVFTGPSRGRLIWTGEVRSNVPITINGKTASYGSISGELPGIPVQIQVHPADLTARGLTVFTLDRTYRRAESAVEAPGPQNGWNPTIYTWNEKRARSVTVTEAPSASNHWKGLTLRGDIDWTPVIIIDWRAIPQQ